MPAVITPDHMPIALVRCAGSVNMRAHQRHRRGHQRRAADAEDRAGGDQRLGAVRVGRDQGGGAEGGGAEQQEPAAADAVAQRAHRHQQAGQDEAVDVEDPQLLGAARLQVGADRRDREVEDGHVHRDQQQRQHQHARAPSIRGGRREARRCLGFVVMGRTVRTS